MYLLLVLISTAVAAPTIRIANSCTCNGDTKDGGLGACKDIYKEKPYCYVDPGVCPDEVESSAAGKWWSYRACRVPANKPLAGGTEETILFPGAEARCRCNGHTNDRGQGECRDTFQDKAFCYVEPGSCVDQVKSTSSGWWSHQACTPGTTSSTPVFGPTSFPGKVGEQPPEKVTVFVVETSKKESLTAATYCPDQCTPQGCFSSQCSAPTCSVEGVEHLAGDSWTVHGNSGIVPRTKVDARAPGTPVKEPCGQVCTCRAEFVSENPLRVGGVVECRAAACEAPTTCSHRGRSYPVGAFLDGCNSCTCDEFGGVTCTEKACPGEGVIPGVVPRSNPSKINFE